MEMEQDRFQERTEDILLWMNENDIGALAPMIQGQITYGRGLTDEKAIGKIWNAIREMLGTLPESPIKRGKQSTLPTAVSVLIDALALEAADAHRTLIGTDNMGWLLCRLGKKANGLWDNEEFADAVKAGLASPSVGVIIFHATYLEKEKKWDSFKAAVK